jgi:hypothetical protein
VSARDESRASWGRAAIRAGTPDHGRNGEGLEGLTTDAVDAVTNVLHAVALAAEGEYGAPAATVLARHVLDSARTHFDAEREPDDIEEGMEGVPYPDPPTSPPVVLVIRDPDWETVIVADGEVRSVTVDLGASFNGPKDFDPETDWGREWVEETLAQVADLPRSSPVRRQVEELVDDLRARGDD